MDSEEKTYSYEKVKDEVNVSGKHANALHRGSEEYIFLRLFENYSKIIRMKTDFVLRPRFWMRQCTIDKKYHRNVRDGQKNCVFQCKNVPWAEEYRGFVPVDHMRSENQRDDLQDWALRWFALYAFIFTNRPSLVDYWAVLLWYWEVQREAHEIEVTFDATIPS